MLIGGDGADFVDGNRQDDTACSAAGDDTLPWDPGDGNDVIEGQDGTDTMLFRGAMSARTSTCPPTAGSSASRVTSRTS